MKPHRTAGAGGPVGWIKVLGLILDRAAGEVSADQEKMLSLAQRNVEGFTRLMSDLLDLSKVEAGKLILNPSPHDLGEIASDERMREAERLGAVGFFQKAADFFAAARLIARALHDFKPHKAVS